MHDVRVLSFGQWQLTVDGVPAPPLHSRVARELLLRMSGIEGEVERDRLVIDLGLDEAVGGAARRRLTQELSRLQRSLGIQLWEGDRDWIAVRPNCLLSSDLDEFLLTGPSNESLSVDAEELSRILVALRLPERGQLLPGHSSDWAMERRSEAAHAEVRQLKQAVHLASERDPETALRCASRWAALEPFNDEAHEATVRLLVQLKGSIISRAYVDDIDRLYRRELGVAVDEKIRQLLVEELPKLAVERSALERLEEAVQSSRAAGAPDEELAVRLEEIDDHLRFVGLQNRRATNLEELAQVAADPVDVAWRRSELLLSGVGAVAASDLARPHQPLDFTIESQALLAIMSCRHQESSVEALAVLRSIFDQATSPLVVAEAGLALAHVHDQMHEIELAEEVLLQVCAEAEEQGLQYHRARTFVALGVNRTRHGDALQAERYLAEARHLSLSIGAEGIGAAAQYGSALFNYHQQRFGSALRHTLAASDVAERQGDIRAEAYYRSGAAVAANALGDLETIRQQYARLREVEKCVDDPGSKLRYNLNDLEAMLNLYDGNDREALAILQDQVESAADAGYHLGSAFSRCMVTLVMLQLGRVADALASARATVRYCRATNVPVYIANEAEGLLGVCLTASGEPKAGFHHLQRSTSVSPFGMAGPAFLLFWLHTAASDLGQEEAARSALVRARRYIQALRSDLTDRQWQVATTRNTELIALVSLVAESQ